MDIIKEIFYDKELTLETTTGGKSIIDKYHPKRKSIVVDMEISSYLVTNNILIEDSGNWETGEVHYIYNRDCKKNLSDKDEIFNKLIPILREIRLNKLIN